MIDQELEMSLQRALSQRRVLAENVVLKKQLDQRFGLENVVGRDHRMQRIYDVIESVADTRATVLITGESGTGKSLIARSLHRKSTRRNKPFVEVACGALPENLLESELFGHVAGAFTGAMGDKVGKFAAADGGTIFLDEIGTATPGMQVKLLRVLQEFEFEPVGGTKTMRVDARVILATNERLEAAVAEGRFRQDLYYRINVINVELPSLRDRISDVPGLAEHFLRKVCDESGKKTRGFHEESIIALQRYSWPGKRARIAKRHRTRGPAGQRRTNHPRRLAATNSRLAHRLGDRPGVAGAVAEGSVDGARAADHHGSVGDQQLESQPDGGSTGDQSHHTLQEDEKARFGRE
ncbi:MAG: sigma-54 dependent transcriptional regulator [Pirellulales bacterium]